MKVYHATPRSNLESIMQTGIDPAFSRGKLSAAWVHTASRMAWAVIHVAKKHAVALDDVIVLEVNVNHSDLTRYSTGLWHTKNVIPAARITRVLNLAVVAASPVSGKA